MILVVIREALRRLGFFGWLCIALVAVVAVQAVRLRGQSAALEMQRARIAALHAESQVAAAALRAWAADASAERARRERDAETVLRAGVKRASVRVAGVKPVDAPKGDADVLRWQSDAARAVLDGWQ